LGKKGILWWEIHRILSEKESKPKYLLFENVDRLLKSPVKQRGKDFAIMLKSLDNLGYAVDWRVINAGDYGMPQRRRRVFFFCYHKSSTIYKSMAKGNLNQWILKKGIIAKSFPIELDLPSKFDLFNLKGNLVEITNTFNIDGKTSPFHNTRSMIDGKVNTIKTKKLYHGSYIALSDIMQNGEVTSDFFINKNDINRWKTEKGSLKKKRVTSEGFEYN